MTETSRDPSKRRLDQATRYVHSRLQELDAPDSTHPTKVHCVLWRSDFESFRQHGVSVTGAEYRRTPEGPSPVHAVTLARDTQTVAALPTHKPSTVSEFTDNELAALNEAIRHFQHLSADECAETARNESTGWQNVNDGDVIPYATAAIDPTPAAHKPESSTRAQQHLELHLAATRTIEVDPVTGWELLHENRQVLNMDHPIPDHWWTKQQTNRIAAPLLIKTTRDRPHPPPHLDYQNNPGTGWTLGHTDPDPTEPPRVPVGATIATATITHQHRATAMFRDNEFCRTSCDTPTSRNGQCHPQATMPTSSAPNDIWHWHIGHIQPTRKRP